MAGGQVGLRERRIEIAEICLGLLSQGDDYVWSDAGDLEEFFVERAADITIRVHVNDQVPLVDAATRVFASGARRVYLGSGKWCLKLSRPPRHAAAFSDQVLTFDESFTSGELFLLEQDPQRRASFMFRLVFDDLWGNLVPYHGGVLVHAACVSVDGEGTMFVGPGGAGKSTMATLWQDYVSARVLHDDRVVIRKKGDRFWAYPVPQMGEFRPSSSRGVALERAFFISHGRENALTPKSAPQIVTGFLSESFVPAYNARAVELALQLLHDLSGVVPCQDLAFVPDGSVVEFLTRRHFTDPACQPGR
jgi:hypothetical protein